MNLSEPYEQWWCCLNPRERDTIKLLTPFWFANHSYIEAFQFTLIAFATGMAGLTLVNQYFLDHYGLTEGIIINEEGDPVNVLFFDPELWPLLYAFAFNENYLCSDPCEAFRFWA